MRRRSRPSDVAPAAPAGIVLPSIIDLSLYSAEGTDVRSIRLRCTSGPLVPRLGEHATFEVVGIERVTKEGQ